MKYKLMMIEGARRRQEEAEAFLQEAGVDAYEVVSGDAIEQLKSDAFLWDCIDEGLIKIAPDVFQLKAYFDEEHLDMLGAIEKEAKALGYEVQLEDVAESDWANDWKQFFHPIGIDDQLTIVPSWENYNRREGERVIVLDPGMAFGSGNHATSYLCAKYLRRYIKDRDLVIDIGCGSGILSLVAIKSGASRAIAVDLDRQCIIATEENAKKNNLSREIEVRHGDLFSVVDEVADVVVSNIFAEVIIGMLEDVKSHIKIDGIYIASGILKEKQDLVEKALARTGFELLETQVEDDWSCVVARRIN